MSRHADVLAAFRDVDHYSNAYGVSLDPAAFGPDAHRAMSFLAMDPPRHTRMRSIVGKSFTPRRVAAMEDGIRALAVAYLAPALEAGSFDFIADFAGRLPMDVISELVGVPAADRAEIRRLADLLVHREDGMTDIPPEGLEAALTLAGYYADMVADRRRHERDDLTWSLLQAEIDGDRLTDDEVIGVPVPAGRGGQRDDDQAARQRLVLGLAQPGPAGQAVGRPGPRAGLGRGDAALRHLDADARAGDAASRCACRASTSRRAGASCCCSVRPTATRTSSPTPSATTSTAAPRTWSASAAAATSAWARRWPAWRRGSR